MLATLTPTDCAKRWQKSGSSNLRYWASCAGCPLGAHHASIDGTDKQNSPVPTNLESNRLAGKVCTRCRKLASRLVGSPKLCMSCYNRQLEFKRGSDRRGKKPKVTLSPRHLFFPLDGQWVEVKSDLSKDPLELLAQAMKIYPGQVPALAIVADIAPGVASPNITWVSPAMLGEKPAPLKLHWLPEA